MFLKTGLKLIVLLLSFQSFAHAEVVLTTVFNVIGSEYEKKVYVLSGADGRVYKLEWSEENLKHMNSFKGQVVKLSYFEKGSEAWIANIEKARPSEWSPESMDLNHFRYNELREFAPTDLQSLDKAEKIFKTMINDGDRRWSQCFKRAHMWAYDMWSKSGIYSQKAFMFYTHRYRQLEKWDWWFHVAPMVVVNGEDYVLDGTFMKKPTKIKEWQNYFLKTDKITCPEITHYEEYEKQQWNRLCYIMKTPMYHFRPLDIELRDKNDVQRNHWVLEELQDAREAFKGYKKVYEGLDTGKSTVKH